MAKRIAPIVPAVRYTHAVTGETLYDAAKALDGVATIVENLTANGHRDIFPLAVKLIYRGKVVEVPCERCGVLASDVTRYMGQSLCANCW